MPPENHAGYQPFSTGLRNMKCRPAVGHVLKGRGGDPGEDGGGG